MKRKQKEIEDNFIKKMDNYDKRNKYMSNTYYNERRNINIDNDIEYNKKNKSIDKGETNSNSDKKEKEIQKQIEEFKTKGYKEFNKLIVEDKEKEEQRTKLYENDEKKKLEIEKKNKEERELASENLNKAKNQIEERIKEYEQKLRSEK